MFVASSLLLFVTLGTTGEDLARARQMVDESLQYSEAIVLLESVLGQPDLTGTQRVETYRLLGIASVAQGSLSTAEAAFLELLMLEPGYRLDPLLSPKILEVFDEARGKADMTPRFVEPSFSSRGKDIHFAARLRDPSRSVDRVEMQLRIDGGAYRAVEVARQGDGLVGALSRPVGGGDRLVLDYYLTGFASAGHAVARLGRDDAPSSFVLEQLRPTPTVEPWYRQWWPWAIAAGVVAGGTVAVLWAVNRDPNEPAGTLDPIYVGAR